MIGLVEGSNQLLQEGTLAPSSRGQVGLTPPGTRSVKTIRGLAGRVRIGAPDTSLTPASGVVAVAELADRLGMVAALDDAIGAIKQRDRGLSAGGLLLALAQTQMLGGDFLVSLDRRRDDLVGEALSVVPTPASTTAAELAARFDPAQLVGIEDGIAELTRRAVTMLPAKRRTRLQAGPVTIDLDGTDVEVYGAKKDGIAYSCKGARAGRPHVVPWAEAGLVVAADLLAGDEDPRPGAADLIDSAVATLHTAGVRRAGTAAEPVTRSMASAACCAPAPSCSPTGNAPDSTPCSPTTHTCRSKRPWASTSASSLPTATPTGPPPRPR
jgi:hypothetical protein